MSRILVVDDDPGIRELLLDYLGDAGFTVDAVEDGPAMRARLETTTPDLVLLDVNLPGEDGFSLARHIRERHDAGIIMLTGVGTTIDRIVGLEIGADDYVVKPVEPEELKARVEAVIRRRRPGTALPDGTMMVGRYRYLPGSRLLSDGTGGTIPLSVMEAELLTAFVRNTGRVLSREDLLDLAPPRGDEPFDRSIDSRITRLRRKLDDDPQNPTIIRTVRGAGYLFQPEV